MRVKASLEGASEDGFLDLFCEQLEGHPTFGWLDGLNLCPAFIVEYRWTGVSVETLDSRAPLPTGFLADDSQPANSLQSLEAPTDSRCGVTADLRVEQRRAYLSQVRLRNDPQAELVGEHF